MKPEICFPMIALFAGELIISYNIFVGLWIHIINLLTIIFVMILSNSNLNIKEKNMLQSSSLLIILRIINLSMPKFFNNLWQYPLIYGIMSIPIYLTIKNQDIPNKELGINFSRLYIYIPIAFIIGIIIALVKYKIIINHEFLKGDIVSTYIIMFFLISAVEEFIFRSIIQTRFEKVFGLRYGLLSTGVIFGITHASYGILNEILFASIFGIIIGFLFQKTRNIFFTISIHGAFNLMSGVIPIRLVSMIDVRNLSSNVIASGGEYMVIFLIIILLISFLISDTKYRSRYASNVLGMYSSALLLTFVAIVIYKVINILKF